MVPVWQTIQGDEETTTSPKVLGLLEAKFVIADTVPSKLKVGIFKEPGKSYDAWVRYSNARNLDDRDPGGHGMAIKLLKVTGGADSTGGLQDFVLFDSPAFFVGNPLQYVEFEEASLRAYGMTASGTNLAVLLNYYWRHPWQLKNLTNAQRSDVKDPLAIQFWSVTPYRLGEAAVKYSAKPVGDGAVAVEVKPSKDMLREAMKVHLDRTDLKFVEFEFRVQLQSDPLSNPIEDPTKLWDESVSVPVSVARILIPTGQPFATDDERDLIAENLSFTPWHTLPEHKPLGGINRVRREVYESLSEFRHALNHRARQEPDARSELK